ncbi:MAG: hypothetical protein H0W70_03390 [Actinobacteria bacterium]|nr:hypothetical protein [Actinomycetota bacterium]
MTAEVAEAAPAAGARRRLRLPSLGRDSEFDLRNTWQVAAGAILMPFGLVIILLAWYGAAHARVVQQQIPYLVSGAFIGLGLMIAGGLLFWAHWLYRIYDQADLHHRELLEAIVALGNGGPSISSDGQTAAAPAASSTGARSGNGRGEFVVTGSGSNFHRPDCGVVAKRRGVRRISAAAASDMQPCRICEPLVQR